MSSILSGLSKGFTNLKNTLGLGSSKKRNNTKRNNKGAATPAATPGATPGATPPAPPAETPGAPPPGPSQSAGKLMRAANLRYLKFYKPKRKVRKTTRRKSKGKRGTRRR
jgi:hypothetical protein